MKKTSKKISVAVVGAGLAGLATAYELAKVGIAVTVFESENRVGGRVKSVLVGKQSVDVGGFIIYPWYTHYHRLINELGLVNQLQPIGKVNVVYQSADRTLYTDTKTIALFEKLKLGKGLLQAWRAQKPNFRTPDLLAFGGQTIGEFLKKQGVASGQLAEFIDTVNQGYCYASMSEYEMSFYAPFVFQTLAKGDLRTGAFFSGNNQLFADVLAQKITELGGIITVRSAVTGVRANTIVCKGKTQKFSAIVMASPVSDLYQKIITAPKFSYTH
ncbi:MAG: FAD-dependent oxidoreductase, partial [Candidatus Magasanikbacteria bacterium]|nr:FAD-dependent oxidoreductase [Candidatus Magasanikbacteria bacterium]